MESPRLEDKRKNSLLLIINPKLYERKTPRYVNRNGEFLFLRFPLGDLDTYLSGSIPSFTQLMAFSIVLVSIAALKYLSVV